MQHELKLTDTDLETLRDYDDRVSIFYGRCDTQEMADLLCETAYDLLSRALPHASIEISAGGHGSSFFRVVLGDHTISPEGMHLTHDLDRRGTDAPGPFKAIRQIAVAALDHTLAA